MGKAKCERPHGTNKSGKTSALLVLLQKSQYQGGSWLLTRQ